MAAFASSWAITKAAADAPTGSSAKEAAIANARRVRRSRIAPIYLNAANSINILRIQTEALILLKHS